jgi:CheY-like chemotaxis protein
LILLNLNMPRVTGLDVLQAMKNDASLHDIPAVVFSSSALDRDKAKCLALGARGFITKPTDLNEFLKVLRNVCDLVGSTGR